MTEQEREEMERLQLEELRFNQKVRDAQKLKAKTALIFVIIVIALFAIVGIAFGISFISLIIEGMTTNSF